MKNLLIFLAMIIAIPVFAQEYSMSKENGTWTLMIEQQTNLGTTVNKVGPFDSTQMSAVLQNLIGNTREQLSKNVIQVREAQQVIAEQNKRVKSLQDVMANNQFGDYSKLFAQRNLKSLDAVWKYEGHYSKQVFIQDLQATANQERVFNVIPFSSNIVDLIFANGETSVRLYYNEDTKEFSGEDEYGKPHSLTLVSALPSPAGKDSKKKK